jgi:hypothetical protein
MIKAYVPSYDELLKHIRQGGFKVLDHYRKAEFLIGDSNSTQLIGVYLDSDSRTMFEWISESGKTEDLIDKMIEVKSDTPILGAADVFLKAYHLL